jgi:hypothetical protein
MAIISVKRGDTEVDLLYQVKVAGSPFDHSDPKFRVLWSMALDADPSVIEHQERDVTDHSKAFGDSALGEVNLPLWDGRTAHGASTTVNVIDNLLDGKISVTAPAAGSGTVDQEIYMTRAEEHLTGPFFRVASGVDGFASGGIVVNIADTDLEDELEIHTDDQSATAGSSALPTPAAPTAVLAGVGAGLVTNGNHGVAVVNKRASDVDVVGFFRLEVVIENSNSGGQITWPEKGFEYLLVEGDI